MTTATAKISSEIRTYLGCAFNASYQPHVYDGFGVPTVAALVIRASSPAEALARQTCWHIAISKFRENARKTGHEKCSKPGITKRQDENYFAADGCVHHQHLAAAKERLSNFANRILIGEK